MISSRRDYLLRIMDEVIRQLARVVLKRRAGDNQEALEAIVEACERLFGLEGNQLFQFTPEQHYAMLTDDAPPQQAHHRVLIYAALNAEAGRVYAKLGSAAMARASFLNALRLTLKARSDFPAETLPEFGPDIAELRAALGNEPLDPETEALFNAVGMSRP